MRPPLRIVRPPLLTGQDEQLIADRLLLDDAVRHASAMLEPERHHHLTPEQWFTEAQHRAGIVAGHLFNASVVGNERDRVKAREEIARVVGLYLALDRTLAGVGEDVADGPA